MKADSQLVKVSIAWLQPNAGALVLGTFLEELVWHGYIRLPAACGCMRAALTTKDTSLGTTDLHTANFFCAWLRRYRSPEISAPSSCFPKLDEMSCVMKTYTMCGVSLVDLIPQVS